MHAWMCVQELRMSRSLSIGDHTYVFTLLIVQNVSVKSKRSRHWHGEEKEEHSGDFLTEL